MSKEQSIEISILRTKMTMLTDQPGEMYALADEVNKELAELANIYPGAKQNELLVFGYLKLMREKKEMQQQYDQYCSERENINNALNSLFSDIE